MNKIGKIICILVFIGIITSLFPSMAFSESRNISGSIKLSSGVAPAGGLKISILTPEYSFVFVEITEGNESAYFDLKSLAYDGKPLVIDRYMIEGNGMSQIVSFDPVYTYDLSGGDLTDISFEVDAGYVDAFTVSGNVIMDSGTAPIGGLEVFLELVQGEQEYLNGITVTIPEGGKSASYKLTAPLKKVNGTCRVYYNTVNNFVSDEGYYPSAFDCSNKNLNNVNIILVTNGIFQKSQTTTQSAVIPSEGTPVIRSIYGSVSLNKGLAPKGGIPVYVRAIALEGNGLQGIGKNDIYGITVTFNEKCNMLQYEIKVSKDQSGSLYKVVCSDNENADWKSLTGKTVDIAEKDAYGTNLTLEPVNHIVIDDTPIPPAIDKGTQNNPQVPQTNKEKTTTPTSIEIPAINPAISELKPRIEVKNAKGRKSITAVISDESVTSGLSNVESGHTFMIYAGSAGEDVEFKLSGYAIKRLEEKNALLRIQTKNAGFEIPSASLNIRSLARRLGAVDKYTDMYVCFYIGKPLNILANTIKNSSLRYKYTPVTGPVEFSAACIYSGKTQDITGFKQYIVRNIAIPVNTNIKNPTTCIVFYPDGSIAHIPTIFKKNGNTTDAVIKSRQNGIFMAVSKSVNYTDIKGSWAEDDILYTSSKFIMGGFPTDVFKPDSNISRAEFISSLIKATGLSKKGSGRNIFADILRTNQYYDDLCVAYDNKVVPETKGSKFTPDAPITKEDAIPVIVNVMKLLGIDAEISDSEVTDYIERFADYNTVIDRDRRDVAVCVKHKLLISDKDKELNMSQLLTRAQTANIINSLLEEFMHS